jgi:hypothetical protein
MTTIMETSPIPHAGFTSPHPKELDFLAEQVAKYRPRYMLEGGCGISSWALRHQHQPEVHLCVEVAEGEWARSVDRLQAAADIQVSSYYPRPGERPLFDLYFLDSGAGVIGNSGLGYHWRGEALLQGLALMSKSGVVIIHDAKRRITHDVRGILSGDAFECVARCKQVAVYEMRKRWDLNDRPKEKQ